MERDEVDATISSCSDQAADCRAGSTDTMKTLHAKLRGKVTKCTKTHTSCTKHPSTKANLVRQNVQLRGEQCKVAPSGTPTNVIHFHSDINNAQIGNNNVMTVHQNIGMSSKHDTDTNEMGGKTEKSPMDTDTTGLTECRRQVTRDDLITLSKFIGRDWQRVGRRLGLEAGQLDNLLADHKSGGHQEVVYRMLSEWSEKVYPEATVGVLARALLHVNATLLKHLAL